MSATGAEIAGKAGANCCGENGLRGMRGCARDAASRQTVEEEQVALPERDGSSLNGLNFVGPDSCNSCAGNDMRGSAACTANSLSCKVLVVNSLRGFGRRTGREKAAETGTSLTRTSTLVRWCKFNFVGAIGILVQFGVLFFLKSALRFNYLAATALAVEVAVVHNFFWHERFTWGDRIRADRGRVLWGGHPSGAKARSLPSGLCAALERCATPKRASQECAAQKYAARKYAIQECATEARARPGSKAAGKSARSTQTHSPNSAQECASQRCASQKLRSPRFARFLRFNFTTGLVSIVGNLGMMRVMVGGVHMHYLAANGIAIAVCSLVNFVVSDGWVFGGEEA